jgi:hypothetical protein
MPEIAAPSAIAESSKGGRPPRPPASQSARPDAAIAMTTLAMTKKTSCCK